jgi:hypothetical protein
VLALNPQWRVLTSASHAAFTRNGCSDCDAPHIAVSMADLKETVAKDVRRLRNERGWTRKILREERHRSRQGPNSTRRVSRIVAKINAIPVDHEDMVAFAAGLIERARDRVYVALLSVDAPITTLVVPQRMVAAAEGPGERQKSRTLNGNSPPPRQTRCKSLRADTKPSQAALVRPLSCPFRPFGQRSLSAQLRRP